MESLSTRLVIFALEVLVRLKNLIIAAARTARRTFRKRFVHLALLTRKSLD